MNILQTFGGVASTYMIHAGARVISDHIRYGTLLGTHQGTVTTSTKLGEWALSFFGDAGTVLGGKVGEGLGKAIAPSIAMSEASYKSANIFGFFAETGVITIAFALGDLVKDDSPLLQTAIKIAGGGAYLALGAGPTGTFSSQLLLGTVLTGIPSILANYFTASKKSKQKIRKQKFKESEVMNYIDKHPKMKQYLLDTTLENYLQKESKKSEKNHSVDDLIS